jgi:hypothetical protein
MLSQISRMKNMSVRWNNASDQLIEEEKDNLN